MPIAIRNEWLLYLQGASIVAVPAVVAHTDSGVLVARAVEGAIEMASRCGWCLGVLNIVYSTVVRGED